MIMHYIIYMAQYYGNPSMLRFFISSCDAKEVIEIANAMRDVIDLSIGSVVHADWDYTSEQGTITIRTKEYVQEDTIRGTADELIARFLK